MSKEPDQGVVADGEHNPVPLKDQRREVDYCDARTRAGQPCRQPKVKGRPRCRMHGGARGSGAPSGERNGRYRDGYYTRQAKEERRWLRSLMALVKETR